MGANGGQMKEIKKLKVNLFGRRKGKASSMKIKPEDIPKQKKVKIIYEEINHLKLKLDKTKIQN